MSSRYHLIPKEIICTPNHILNIWFDIDYGKMNISFLDLTTGDSSTWESEDIEKENLERICNEIAKKLFKCIDWAIDEAMGEFF